MPTLPKPIRLAITSDLHLDFSGNLTPEHLVEEVVRQIAAAKPDAILLGGDLACDSASFFKCVELFAALELPLGVIPGNHDLWTNENEDLSTEMLLTQTLPALARKAGAVWLENHDLVVGSLAICGTIGWYDYSAVDPRFAGTPEGEFARRKAESNADAWKMDWSRADPVFAAECRAQILKRLKRHEARPETLGTFLLTHVPVFESQLVRKSNDDRWGFSNAYFGHLTLGAEILPLAKLKAVASGHTHAHREGLIQRSGLDEVKMLVVGSDYGDPTWHLLEIV
jgi:hypothetical protein